ncbi:A1S_2505 family phage non-structural protein, partial [Escherichia coli]|uniref:A1S_2505 family phage non-structural protein n=1 Tax=Escherichia coli TaxID=562 RepID=UPI003D05BAAC
VGHRLSKMPLAQIKIHAERFVQCAREHPEFTFLLTLVGCGLAEHKVKDIAPMFKDCPENVIKPKEFHL